MVGILANREILILLNVPLVYNFFFLVLVFSNTKEKKENLYLTLDLWSLGLLLIETYKLLLYVKK